jgi:hypothetical protein
MVRFWYKYDVVCCKCGEKEVFILIVVQNNLFIVSRYIYARFLWGVKGWGGISAVSVLIKDSPVNSFLLVVRFSARGTGLRMGRYTGCDMVRYILNDL